MKAGRQVKTRRQAGRRGDRQACGGTGRRARGHSGKQAERRAGSEVRQQMARYSSLRHHHHHSRRRSLAWQSTRQTCQLLCGGRAVLGAVCLHPLSPSAAPHATQVCNNTTHTRTRSSSSLTRASDEC
ncbi:hypothetical protein E2C01_055837 [Portunus trituberculatus]|uniref:Uncharacterized protein n=1 Tax=Portunus trituberculatus TaxID=210409 RepID=A0A5B7GNU6_PORTR|nr:hypothetical protein [Portunus trituberculatus]